MFQLILVRVAYALAIRQLNYTFGTALDSGKGSKLLQRNIFLVFFCTFPLIKFCPDKAPFYNSGAITNTKVCLMAILSENHCSARSVLQGSIKW